MHRSTVSLSRRFLSNLALLGLISLGCSTSKVTGPRVSDLRLAIEFPATASSNKTPGLSETASVSQLDSIRVSVFALADGGTEAVLARTAVGLSAGQTEFEVSLTVASVPGYRVQVEAIGQRQRPGRTNDTTYGLQYWGSAILETAALGLKPIVVEMRDAVPFPTGRRGYDATETRIDSLAWGAIPGAISYTIRDSLNELAAGVTNPHYEIVAGSGVGYRVSASLPGGLESAFSEALSFAASAPFIRSLLPDSVAVGDTGLALSVTGAFFQLGATVTWNGADLATTYASSSSLTATVPGNLTLTPSAVAIRVRNPDGQVSDAQTFWIVFPAPTITGVTPDPVPAGLLAGATLTVAGANYRPGAIVTWNRVDLSTTYKSSSLLAPYVPPALIANEGSASLQARNPDGLTSNTWTVLIRAQ